MRYLSTLVQMTVLPVSVLCACSFETWGTGTRETVGDDSTASASEDSFGPMADTDDDAAISAGETPDPASGASDRPADEPDGPEPKPDNDEPDDTSGASDQSEPETPDEDEPRATATVRNVEDFAACQTRIGCWNQQSLIPAAPFLVLECFESPLDPPFEVTAIDVQIAWRANVFASLDVAVFEGPFANLGPALTIEAHAGPPDVGLNALELAEPVAIDTKEFCVGFRVEQAGWAGGIEFATYDGAGLETSFYGSCGVSSWTTIAANWCVGASVREL